MKKQILFIAVTSSAILFSCKKEKIESAQSTQAPAPTAPATASGQKAIPPSLNQNLEVLFRFDGNLLDAMGKVDAAASSTGADLYTDDRKGNPNAAIKFTGRYGLITDSVPTPTNCSVAAWVKYDTPKIENWFVYGLIGFGQSFDQYVGYVSTPATTGVLSGPIDDQWHFLVSTYDGQYIRFYVDGNFVGSQFNPGTFNSGPGNPGSTFWIGGDILGTGFWFGAMDDLRFYSRTLSDKDVTKLYNL